MVGFGLVGTWLEIRWKPKDLIRYIESMETWFNNAWRYKDGKHNLSQKNNLICGSMGQKIRRRKYPTLPRRDEKSCRNILMCTVSVILSILLLFVENTTIYSKWLDAYRNGSNSINMIFSKLIELDPVRINASVFMNSPSMLKQEDGQVHIFVMIVVQWFPIS